MYVSTLIGLKRGQKAAITNEVNGLDDYVLYVLFCCRILFFDFVLLLFASSSQNPNFVVVANMSFFGGPQ